VDFALFLLLNAVLFIRPAEISEALHALPIYYWVIIATTMVAAPSVLRQLTPQALAARPITVCVLLLIPSIMLSQFSHTLFGQGLSGAIEFAQVALYYLLLVGIVNTPARLQSFLKWLLLYIVLLAGLALVHYHGIAEIPALAALQERAVTDTGDEIVVVRLRSTGLFNDPNDLSQILSVGTIIAAYLFGQRPSLAWRCGCLAAGALLVYALVLTKSRGGVLAFAAGFASIIYVRYGWKKAVLLSALSLPIMMVVFSGRQANIDFGNRNDTAQERIHLWREGFVHFKDYPVFGIGQGKFADEMGLVAHNSYVHSYTELGFFGGTWFVAVFYLSGSGLLRLGRYDLPYPDGETARLRPYMFGIVTSYAVGLYSLSRNVGAPTYLFIGLAAAYTAVVPAAGLVLPSFGTRLVRNLVVVSATVFVCLYVFVRLVVQ
jgi:O-antigen ligase